MLVVSRECKGYKTSAQLQTAGIYPICASLDRLVKVISYFILSYDMAIDYKEFRDLSAIIIALAFGFAYKFAGPATLSNWSANFILILVLVAISILVHEFAHKIVARKFGADVKPQIWLSGIIIMLLVMVLTNGFIIFAAIWAVSIIPIRLFRPGRTSIHTGPQERSVIAMSGLLANLGLAVVAKLLFPVLGDVALKLMTINLTIALFNLVPFFTLLPMLALQRMKQRAIEAPYVEGEYIFFGSRTGWVFLFVFSAVLTASLFFLGAIVSVALALILAVMLWIAWHYFFEAESIKDVKMTSPSFRSYKKI